MSIPTVKIPFSRLLRPHILKHENSKDHTFWHDPHQHPHPNSRNRHPLNQGKLPFIFQGKKIFLKLFSNLYLLNTMEWWRKRWNTTEAHKGALQQSSIFFLLSENSFSKSPTSSQTPPQPSQWIFPYGRTPEEDVGSQRCGQKLHLSITVGMVPTKR